LSQGTSFGLDAIRQVAPNCRRALSTDELESLGRPATGRILTLGVTTFQIDIEYRGQQGGAPFAARHSHGTRSQFLPQPNNAGWRVLAVLARARVFLGFRVRAAVEQFEKKKK